MFDKKRLDMPLDKHLAEAICSDAGAFGQEEADEIAREAGSADGERFPAPEHESAGSAEAIQSAVAAGRLDAVSPSR